MENDKTNRQKQKTEKAPPLNLREEKQWSFEFRWIWCTKVLYNAVFFMSRLKSHQISYRGLIVTSQLVKLKTFDDCIANSQETAALTRDMTPIRRFWNSHQQQLKTERLWRWQLTHQSTSLSGHEPNTHHPSSQSSRTSSASQGTVI